MSSKSNLVVAITGDSGYAGIPFFMRVAQLVELWSPKP